MDKFAELKAFVAVADASGFAAAARQLGQSRSALNRLVISLEERLETQLLNRSTRYVSPTSAGRAFYESASRILADLEEAETSLTTGDAELVGPFRINAPMSFGTMKLSDAVIVFQCRHPRLEMELHLEDRFVDPIAEGYDVVVRIGEPDDETSLVDHRIIPVERVLCASPSYLAEYGTPSCLQDLRHHRLLHYGNQASGRTWQLEGPGGKESVQAFGGFCSNNIEPLRDAAVAGLGITIIPVFVAEEQFADGRLKRILEDYRPPIIQLQVIYPPARYLSPKVRLFTEFMIERFGGRNK